MAGFCSPLAPKVTLGSTAHNKIKDLCGENFMAEQIHLLELGLLDSHFNTQRIDPDFRKKPFYLDVGELGDSCRREPLLGLGALLRVHPNFSGLLIPTFNTGIRLAKFGIGEAIEITDYEILPAAELPTLKPVRSSPPQALEQWTGLRSV